MRLAIINSTGGGMSVGYRTYLENVLPRLAVHPKVKAVLCATPQTIDIKTWFSPVPTVQFIPCRSFRFLHHRLDAALVNAVRVFSPDVVFIPVERYLAFSRVPVVTMLQNMGPLLPVTGNPLSERLRYIAQRYETRMAIRRADRVIVPTNFVLNFLVEQWHIPRDRVTMIHYGAESLLNVLARRPEKVQEEWMEKFLFTAGSIEPYRGLEDLLCALRLLPPMVKLVIAGEARRNMMRYQRQLLRWIKKNGLSDRIRWVGALSREEMAWCYRQCTVFVMTSRLESFGIIGLEALVHGCLCIAAKNPPLPEIFDTAAWYYPPMHVNALAERINAALSLTSAVRHTMSESAQQRAATFSWDRNVEQLVSVLTEAHRTFKTCSS